jgi:hypothetical protein
MPFIHVRSLPFESSFDVAYVVEGITRDFADDTGIGLEHVTATWRFFSPGYYAVAGISASHQPHASHPVLVDLVAPDFNPPDLVERMLVSVAFSISTRTGIPMKNIFVNHRAAGTGTVLDEGEVARW